MRWAVKFWEEPEDPDSRMCREELVVLAPSKGQLRWVLRAAEKVAEAALRAMRNASALERMVRSQQRISVAKSRAEKAYTQLFPPAVREELNEEPKQPPS